MDSGGLIKIEDGLVFNFFVPSCPLFNPLFFGKHKEINFLKTNTRCVRNMCSFAPKKKQTNN